MPLIKKFVEENDESIFLEMFANNLGGITFFCKNENLNESIMVDLNLEDIDLIIENLIEIKKHLNEGGEDA